MIDLTALYQPGESMACSFVVSAGDAVGNYSPLLSSLLSSTGLLNRLLALLREFCDRKLPEGFVTVGHSMSVEHLSAVLIGTALQVDIRLEAVEGNKLELICMVSDAIGLVAKVRTERAVVGVMPLMAEVHKHTRELGAGHQASVFDEIRF